MTRHCTLTVQLPHSPLGDILLVVVRLLGVLIGLINHAGAATIQSQFALDLDPCGLDTAFASDTST